MKSTVRCSELTAACRLFENVSISCWDAVLPSGSKRSSHSNAYFYGFCKNKRIVRRRSTHSDSFCFLPFVSSILDWQVLFDTLIKQTTKEEVVAILGHELGHWKMNHLPKSIFVAELQTFTTFYVFSLIVHNQAFYQAFGMLFSTAVSFLLLQTGVSLHVGFASMPVMIGLFLFGTCFPILIV